MDLQNLSNPELLELVNKTTDKDALREIATFVDVTFSGNTGMETLKTKLVNRITALIEEDSVDEEDLESEEETAVDPVMAALLAQNAAQDSDEDVHVEQVKPKYTTSELLEMDAAKVKDPVLRRQAIKAQALRLRRVRITNVDPADAVVPSTMVTLYSKYTGKVSKLIPHDSEFYENGYHIPQIIYDELKTRTFNMRKEVKRAGSSFGIKEYKTVQMKKFIIEDLPDLTPAQLKNLAASQEGRGAIDRSA